MNPLTGEDSVAEKAEGTPQESRDIGSLSEACPLRPTEVRRGLLGGLELPVLQQIFLGFPVGTISHSLIQSLVHSFIHSVLMHQAWVCARHCTRCLDPVLVQL